MSEYETTEYHDGQVRVVAEYDYEPDNPREVMDDDVTFALRYRNYNLGDAERKDEADEALRIIDESLSEYGTLGWQVAASRIRARFGARVVKPVYVYEHGGITISTGSNLDDPEGVKGSHNACDPGGWDTSMVGLVFDDGTADDAEASIAASVKGYDDFLTGACFVMRAEVRGIDGEWRDYEDGCYHAVSGWDAIDEAMKDLADEAYAGSDEQLAIPV